MPAHVGKRVFVEVHADTPPHGRHERAQSLEGFEIEFRDVVVDERLLEHRAFQLDGIDITFDAAMLLAARDHRLQRRAQHFTREIEHGALELMGLKGGP